ncbi:MAG: manganese efflux pump [Ruminococcaceae bacterium]|nr:manganese efflux pump [Oscillospiraceae bacterium]
MSVIELLLLAVALAMDAFAVSICKGLSSKESYIKTGLVCGAWFGIFQALMPFLGWLLASLVATYVESVSAYIAFILLVFLGGKMIFEAIKEGDTCPCCEENEKNASLSFRVMLGFAIATSIDAMAAGVTLAVNGEKRVALALAFIGTVTFLFCFIGAAVGAKVGERWRSKAEIIGGVILIALGAKILIEYLLSALS